MVAPGTPRASASGGSQSLVVPDIPEQTVRLKVDIHSGRITVQEDALLHTLAKLRKYVRDSMDQTLATLREESTQLVDIMKNEAVMSMREVISQVESELAKKHFALQETVQSQEAEMHKISAKMQQVEKAAQEGGLQSAGGDAQETFTTEDAAVSPMQPTASEPPPGDQPRTPDGSSRQRRRIKMQRSRSVFISSTNSGEKERRLSFDDTAERQKAFSSDLDGASAKDDDQERESQRVSSRQSDGKETQPKDSSEDESKGGANSAVKESEATPAVTSAEALEMKQSIDGCKEQIEKVSSKIDHVAEHLRGKVYALEDHVKDAEAHRQLEGKRNEQQDKRNAERDAQSKEFNKKLQEVVGRVLRVEENMTPSDTFAATKREVAELFERMSKAALASVIEPKLDGALVKIDRLAKSCSRTDEQLEQSEIHKRDVESKFQSCLSKMDELCPMKEVDRMSDGFEQQMSGLGQLLTHVQNSVGDLSAAILALSSKADGSDVNILRKEMCQMSETLKDREQAVLFGARCLSCNRVFDDISKEANAEDLYAEKQRNALFAQVQRALHSPKIDPLAKIKVLAVKVGRPTTVPPSSGTGSFEGRDTDGFACGLGDVHLVPVRDGMTTSDLSILPRPEGVPRTARGRRLKGAPQRESKAESQEGPMDFKHPLSQLLDRGPSRGRGGL